jgi:hypothetical protein
MATDLPEKGLLPLLAACGRTRMDEATASELRRLVTDEVHWPTLIRDAQLHGMLPLLARNLSRHAQDLLPPAQLESLRNLYHAQGARNTLIFRTLLSASDQLYRAGIPAIAIKGPMLARRAYGDLTLRQFSDLDFLIREDTVESVINVLSGAGYQHVRTGQNWQYLKFRSPEGFLLDLQWGLGPDWFRFPLDYMSIWDRAEYCELDGQFVLELPDHDTLMLLCGHATKHCWSKIGWLVDLNEYLLRRGQFVDWHALIRQAESVGGLRMLLLGLAFASDILGGDIPVEIEELIRTDKHVGELSQIVRVKLATSGQSLAGSEGAFSQGESQRFHLAARERLRDRLPYARHMVTRKLDWGPQVQRLIRAGKRLGRSADG